MAFFDPPPSGTPSRLSIHHPAPDIYDSEITTCCLPPPSPAPNSDRFIGIPPQHHQQVCHFDIDPFDTMPRNSNDIYGDTQMLNDLQKIVKLKRKRYRENATIKINLN